MKKTLYCLTLGALSLGSCQTTPATTADSPTAPTAVTTPPAAPGAPTESEARTAVSRFMQGQPNAALYQLDSAQVVDVDTHWQVLVPRTDWANRMPNKAAFEVDKQTGAVTTRAVK